MPMKTGGGGKPQEYDPSNGRYGHGFMTSGGSSSCLLSQKNEKQTKASSRRKRMDEAAAKSDDPLLFDVYCRIQKAVPDCVMKVNENYRLSPTERGEIDIETRHLVIEVKSGSVKHFAKQFFRERKYADKRHKELIIFAPFISATRKSVAEKMGFTIITSFGELHAIIIKKEGKR